MEVTKAGTLMGLTYKITMDMEHFLFNTTVAGRLDLSLKYHLVVHTSHC